MKKSSESALISCYFIHWCLVTAPIFFSMEITIFTMTPVTAGKVS